jgi:RHS repeat-associated protein
MARSRRRRSRRLSFQGQGCTASSTPGHRPLQAGLEHLEPRRLLAVLYWDPDGNPANNVLPTGAGLGGSGTWTDGGAATWFDPALNAGAGGHVAWDSSRGDTAIFAGLGDTVTISGQVGAAVVKVPGTGYAVVGGGFDVPASGTTFNTVTTTRFDAVLTGDGKFVKTGAATLTLGAPAHAHTGDILVSAGTLDVRGTIQSHVTSAGGDVQGVMFRDPDLAAAVREALGLAPDAFLSPEVVAQAPPLTTLSVDANLVRDLTGIANLPALVTLEFVPGDHAATPQGLSSLAPLAGLGNLAALSLQHVGLTEATLATLPALPGLTRLDVRSNALSAVPAAIANLPRLASLMVHGNPLLTDNPRAGLAALRGRAIDVDVAPDRPETATSIADLAARLYFLPLEMLEYVTNTIAFCPYVGAMKGPLATLQTKSGNDWDTNSLLAALYDAAGISTRYVAGVVEITPDQLRDYVGTRDATAAAQILSSAGLLDGQWNRLKHTWLEALVTVPATGRQAWTPIDASWKVRDFRPGLPGVVSSVPFSPLETDYFTNPAWQKKSTAEYYEAKVAGWLARNRPDLSLADVGYDGPIRQQAFTSLPTALPYTVLDQPAEAARPSAIPAAAHYTVTVDLAYASDPSRKLFGPAGASLRLADVALSRITIDPGVDARPTLRRDGVAIAKAPTAVPTPANTPLTLTIKVTAPAGGTTYSRSFTRAADRFIAIGLDANQFSESLLAEKRSVANAQQVNQANGVAVDQDQGVGGLLDLAIASYFTAADADETSIAALTSGVPIRWIVALGIATGGPRLVTQSTAGLQFPALPADMGIDVPGNVMGGLPIDPSTTPLDLTRGLLMGYANSSLEGLVLEDLTSYESVSTVKAFQLAATAAGGLGNMVEINAANVARIATLLPGVRLGIRNSIATAVTTGLAAYPGAKFKALVPKNEISVGVGAASKQWKGVGYTLTIANTGETIGFMIHGSVGSGPILAYGGATSWIAVPPPVIRASAVADNPNNYLGDPVNIANGNVYHEETDFEIPNLGNPLAFRRRYDSIHTVSRLGGTAARSMDRGMGKGWSFSYGDWIDVGLDGTVTWNTGAGLRYEFRPWRSPAARPAAGNYIVPEGLFGGLAGSSATGFTWTDWQGNRTTFGPALALTCPLSGIQDRFGNGVAVERVPGTTRPAKVTDLRDPSRFLTFTYNRDATPHVTAVTDFTGRQWTYTYVGDRLATATAPAPAPGAAAPVVRYAYYTDAARNDLLQSVTDPGGGVTSWEYYANRRGFRVTDTEGLRHSFTYNLHRRQSTFIDERGQASRHAYDDRGNLLESRQPDRTTERATWSAAGLKLSATDAYGAMTTFAYDAASGQVTSVTDPLGAVTTLAYTTGTYRDVATITRLNRPNDASDDVVTRFAYDASGFLTSRIDDAGTGRLNLETRWSAAPGGRGLAATKTSPAGFVTRFTFDAAGQVLSRTADAAPGATTTESFAYDRRGSLLSRTDANGGATTFSYDALGRKTSETSPDPDGSGPLPAPVSTFAYDASGNLVKTTTGDGRVTRVDYDRRQRETRRTAADGTYTLLAYDPAGNKAAATDAAGRVTKFVYDPRGRLVATLLPDGTTTRARVDGGGRVVATIDQAGATTTTTYDLLGRKVREKLPDGAATAWGYDSRGNLQYVTPSFADQPGVTAGAPAWSTHFEYDALGRKTKQTQADPDGPGPAARPVTSFAYDKEGNLTATTDPRGFTTTFAYDQLGRKIAETLPDPDGAGPLGPLVKRFGYDQAGLLRFEVAPGGAGTSDTAFTTEHVYDALGREIRTLLPDPDGAGPLERPVSTWTFSAAGFPATTTDALGRTTRLATDVLGRVVATTDPAGGTTTTVYDAVGNAVIVTDALGRRTVTTYDAMDRKVAVRSPRPDATAATPVARFVYDSVGNCITTIDPLGRATWRRYDALRRVTTVTDPLGIRPGDPAHSVRTEYDLAGRVTARIDELGRRTDFVFDALGRKTRVIGPDAGQGRPTNWYGYDAAGNLRYATDPRGGAAGDPGFTTWSFYDGLGRVTAVVDALGADWPVAAVPDSLPATMTTNVTVSTYDAAGRLAAVTDPLGRRTDYAYDTLGRTISETGPAAAPGAARPVIRNAYDAVGNLRSVTDPLGFVTATDYDQLDRPTAVTDATGLVTRKAYDPLGNPTSLVDAAGNATRYAYDRLGRLVRETDPLGNSATSGYDLAGRKTTETDRLGRVTSFVYDAADRLLEERWQQTAAGPVFHTIRRFYDAADQLVGVTETDTANAAATTAWQFDYDAGGRLVRSRMAPGELAQVPALQAVPTPAGALTAADASYDWDADGRPERYDPYQLVLAPGDQLLLTVSSTAFDPVLIVQRPDGGLATAIFDDASGGGTSARLRVVADAAGPWLIAVTSRDETAAGGYDLQIVQDAQAFVPDALVEHDFTYDKAGNLLSTTEDQAAVADVRSFGKAATGLGAKTTRVVDALGRVTRWEQVVAGSITKRVDQAYRADGSVVSTTRYAGAGVDPVGTTTNAFDGRGRLTGITHAPAADGAIAYAYGYDAADRIVSFATPEGTSTFALDATDQLLSASLTGESYAYDVGGNRAGAGIVVGAGNRQLSDGTYRHAYDAEGNRTAKFVDADGSQTLSAGDTDVTVYGWDQRNRLVAVSHVGTWGGPQAAVLAAFGRTAAPLPGSDLDLRYTYDHADRRIRRSLDADGAAGAAAESVSYAAYAGEARTLEIDRGLVYQEGGRVVGILGGVVQRTFYGAGVDEVLAVDRVAGGATSTSWTLGDHQDSVRDILSGSGPTRGQVVEHRQYDSYGRLVRRTAAPGAGAAATAGVGIDFGYAGRPLEERTGLSDNRARWYEPGTGRFLNEDPSGFKGGDANLFRYVGNDPVDQVDPSGLAARWTGGASRTFDLATRRTGLDSEFSRNTFTGRPDYGIPFGEFLVTGPSNPNRSDVAWPHITVGGLLPGQGRNLLGVGIDGTSSAAWLAKTDAYGNFVNQRTQPDGSTRWNSHVRNLIADCSPYATTIYSPGPAQYDGGDSVIIANAVAAATEAQIRRAGGGTTVFVAGFSRGGPIAARVAAMVANPPPGSPARQVAFVGMYDPVDTSYTLPNAWARIDPKLRNVTIVGPAGGRDPKFNVDYPVGWPSPIDLPFVRLSLNGRITTTGTATNVSRFQYNASHGALGGTPGFNRQHVDSGPYDYTRDVRHSIDADRDIRNGMQRAGFDFIPIPEQAWYGFPATRPPATVRE